MGKNPIVFPVAKNVLGKIVFCLFLTSVCLMLESSNNFSSFRLESKISENSIYLHMFGPKLSSSVSKTNMFHGKSQFVMVNEHVFCMVKISRFP